jgi:hypothetical protein
VTKFVFLAFVRLFDGQTLEIMVIERGADMRRS